MSYIHKYPNGFDDKNFQSAARYTSDNKECVRLLGLALLQKKLSEMYVAKLLDVHPQTVFSWLQRYKSGGIEAIKDQGGREEKISLIKIKKINLKIQFLIFKSNVTVVELLLMMLKLYSKISLK